MTARAAQVAITQRLRRAMTRNTTIGGMNHGSHVRKSSINVRKKSTRSVSGLMKKVKDQCVARLSRNQPCHELTGSARCAYQLLGNDGEPTIWAMTRIASRAPAMARIFVLDRRGADVAIWFIAARR